VIDLPVDAGVRIRRGRRERAGECEVRSALRDTAWRRARRSARRHRVHPAARGILDKTIEEYIDERNPLPANMDIGKGGF